MTTVTIDSQAAGTPLEPYWKRNIEHSLMGRCAS